MKNILVAVFTVLLLISASIQAQDTLSRANDIMFVFDNSGSMLNSDPNYKFRTAILNFFNEMPPQSRMGFILFSDKAKILLPLVAPGKEQQRVISEKLSEKIDYTGRLTNIPDAIERAFYELRQNSPKENGKVIVLVTDGMIDLGTAERNAQKLNWLKETLLADCVTLGVRIFGVAFTEQADYELLQTLSQKTGGEYYRALLIDEIPPIFSKIVKAAALPIPEKKEDARPDTLVKKEIIEYRDTPYAYILGILAIVLLAVGTAVFFVIRRRADSRAADMNAKLIDLNGVTGNREHKLTRTGTKIGRGSNNHICIPKEDVSALHAVILFSDDLFYIIDQDSLNHTFRNKEKLTKFEKIPLKTGTVLTFAKYRFEFILENEAPAGGTMLASDIEKYIGAAAVNQEYGHDDAADQRNVPDLPPSEEGLPSRTNSGAPDED